MHMKPTTLYVEVIKAPPEDVQSADDVLAYAFPDPYAPGRFEGARQDISAFGADYFVIGDVEISIFEMAWHLTGMEKYLIGMAGEEQWLEVLNDRVESGLSDWPTNWWTLGLMAFGLVRISALRRCGRTSA